MCGFAGSGLVQRVIDGEPYYRKPVENVVAGAYRPLIGHAAAVIWNHLAWRTASTGKLLAQATRHLGPSHGGARGLVTAGTRHGRPGRTTGRYARPVRVHLNCGADQ